MVNQNAGKTHCKRGHEFTPENTRLITGGRECRICKGLHRVRRQRDVPFYERDRCREHKAILVEMKGNRCLDCGGEFPDCCYHFHHRDPMAKTFDLGQNMLRSLSVLKIEAEKCDLLCANCHAIKSYGDKIIADKTRAGIARSKGQ
jgi:hypothetical protein